MLSPAGILDRSLLVSLVQVLIAGLFMFASGGCKDITEADSAYRGQVTIFSEELVEIGSIPVDETPGCLMTFPGHLLVATKEGNLNLYNAETFELLGVHKIGPSTPEGYSEMIHIPERNSAYLIGAYGNILDVDLPECTVEDMFSVCQLPLDLVYGGAGSSFFYVSDGINNTLNRVNTSTNSSAGLYQFEEAIRTAALHAPDSVMVVSCGRTYVGSTGPGGTLYFTTALMEEASCIGNIPNRDYTVAVSGGDVGVLSYHLNEDSTEFIWTFDQKIAVEGATSHITCNTTFSAYLLSYTGNETSVLYQYDYTNGSILNQVELQGFPLDLEVTSSNNVFALTAID